MLLVAVARRPWCGWCPADCVPKPGLTASPTFSQPPPNPGNTVRPGPLIIKGVRDGTDVTFTWTYANSLASDDFYYQLKKGQPPLRVAVPG